MPLFVKFEDGYIVEGPVEADAAPQGYVGYREVVNIPANSGVVTVSLSVVDGVCVKTITGQTSYIKQRLNAYPAMGDQLDMFWHAMHTGVLPIIEPFYSDILVVKQQYPKPSP
jgi:hypothetical protein